MQQPRAILIHPSLTRKHLLLGVEREPLIIAATLCTAMALSMVGVSYVGFFLSVVLWIASVFGLRLMGKEDPIMFKVGIRHLRFHSPFMPSYYPARSYINSKSQRLPKQWLTRWM